MKTILSLVSLLSLAGLLFTTGCEDEDHHYRGGYYGPGEYGHGYYHHDWDDHRDWDDYHHDWR